MRKDGNPRNFYMNFSSKRWFRSGIHSLLKAKRCKRKRWHHWHLFHP